MAVQFENGDFQHLTHMTSRSGEISANYYELVDCFGPPVDGPDEDMDKVSCNWDILFTIPDDDGDSEEIVATIYDWKCGKLTPGYDMNWLVGGHSRHGSRPLWLVMDALEEYRTNGEPYKGPPLPYDFERVKPHD